MDNSIRTFLRELGRVPLLTHAEEITYGRQVQQMMTLLSAKGTLTEELQREPTSKEWALHVHISEAELKEVLEHGHKAKRMMVEANLRLVVAVAKEHLGRGLEFLDLVQEGSLGLHKGVEKFDPSKGCRFSSYCWHWIRQAITHAIYDKGRTIRLPYHVNEKLGKILKTQRQLSQQQGCTPTTSALATELEMSQQQIRQHLEWSQSPASLNCLIGDGGELGDMLASERITPEEYLIQSTDQSEQVDEVEQMMAELSPRQRQVLALRFGLADGQELKLNQIASRLHISYQMVKQAHTKALEKLHQMALNQPTVAAIADQKLLNPGLSASSL